MHSIRNKLYNYPQKPGSSRSLHSSPTSAAVALTREYEDFHSANIFPSVAEDASVVSHKSGNDTMESPTTGSGTTTTSTPTLEEQQAEIESLRAQLAERDHTINELQRRQQEDRRAHSKLKEKWDLFCSNNSSGTTSGSGSNQKKQQDDQLMKLHAHLEGLEQAKEACMTKAVKLSVELAASKEQVSDLESRLEEACEIIKYQNGTPVSARFLAGALGTPSSSASKSGGGGGTLMDNNSSRRGSSRRLASPSGTPKAISHSPVFPPITDIELNTDDDEPSHNQDSHDDDDYQVGYRSAPPIHNVSLHDDQDQFDMDNLSVSGRGPDSLSFSQRTYASTGGNTMGTYSERGTRSSSRVRDFAPNNHTTAPAPSRLSFSGLRGFLNHTNNKTAESEE